MPSKLGQNFSQFRIKHLFLAIVSFAVASAIYSWNASWGSVLLLSVAIYWVGFVVLCWADSLDSRPIDERTRLSQGLGLVGGLMIVGSIFMGVFWTFITIVNLFNG